MRHHFSKVLIMLNKRRHMEESDGELLIVLLELN